MGIRFIANMAEQVGHITQIMPCRFFIINPILDGRYCLLSHVDNKMQNIYTFFAIAGFLDNIEQVIQYNVAKSNQYLAGLIPFISFIGMEFFKEYGEILFRCQILDNLRRYITYCIIFLQDAGMNVIENIHDRDGLGKASLANKIL